MRSDFVRVVRVASVVGIVGVIGAASRERPVASGDLRLGNEVHRLRAHFDGAVERALQQVRETPEERLLESREVGRARLPSTMMGLLFHGAEHTQRHVGQFISTVRIVRA